MHMNMCPLEKWYENELGYTECEIVHELHFNDIVQFQLKGN